MSNFRIVEDPRIAQVAKICHDEMLLEIGKRMETGEDFFHARECVMAERGNEIARTYGKEVATRAMKALTAINPRDLPFEMLFRQDKAIADGRLRAANFIRGGEHYWSPLQLWKQRNSWMFEQGLFLGIMTVIASPAIGAAGVIVFGGFSHWLPVTKHAALLGIALLLITFFVDAAISNKPRQRWRTAPTTREELEQQRTMIRAQQDEEMYQRLESEEAAEMDAKQRAKQEREQVDMLKRIARDKEIDAYQERRRLGTSLPTDPLDIPRVRRAYQTRRASRNF